MAGENGTPACDRWRRLLASAVAGCLGGLRLVVAIVHAAFGIDASGSAGA